MTTRRVTGRRGGRGGTAAGQGGGGRRIFALRSRATAMETTGASGATTTAGRVPTAAPRPRARRRTAPSACAARATSRKGRGASTSGRGRPILPVLPPAAAAAAEDRPRFPATLAPWPVRASAGGRGRARLAGESRPTARVHPTLPLPPPGVGPCQPGTCGLLLPWTAAAVGVTPRRPRECRQRRARGRGRAGAGGRMRCPGNEKALTKAAVTTGTRRRQRQRQWRPRCSATSIRLRSEAANGPLPPSAKKARPPTNSRQRRRQPAAAARAAARNSWRFGERGRTRHPCRRAGITRVALPTAGSPRGVVRSSRIHREQRRRRRRRAWRPRRCLPGSPTGGPARQGWWLPLNRLTRLRGPLLRAEAAAVAARGDQTLPRRLLLTLRR
ncbi:unnamed protein product [Ectocarpus fasciculatus]